VLRDQLLRALPDAYVLNREPGGGMSRVFIAPDVARGRHVVVKVLPDEMLGHVSLDRFKREIASPRGWSIRTSGSADGR